MFHHHQEMDGAGRVRSVQTLDLPHAIIPTPADAAEAGRLYWDFLRRFGRGLLAITPRPDGGVNIGAAGLRLIGFAPPTIVEHDGGFAARYGISHGAAVHRSARHQGYLQMGLGSQRVSLTVDDYLPALVGANRNPLRVRLYNGTQSALHLAVARRYLHDLCRWAATAEPSGALTRTPK